MSADSSSSFSCYTCGLDELTLDMRRASLTRRTEMPTAPTASLPRSRSVENVEDHDDGVVVDKAGLGEEEGTLKHPHNGNQLKEHQHQDSERVVTSNRGYRRAVSDPFDSPHDPDDQRADGTAAGAVLDTTPAGDIIPTLPRYPVAETRNKNCWSEPPVSIFHVRGPHYLADSKKIPSGPYLLAARGCDLFLSENSNRPFDLEDKTHWIFGGQLRKIATLAINFRFPWGYLNLYFEIPAKLTAYMNPTGSLIPPDSSLSVPEKVFARWLMGDTDYRNERLKLIPYVAEGPWVVRSLVTGRPAIIGKKLPVSYQYSASSGRQAPLLTATLDIGNSSATAKRIVSVCRRYMAALTVDIGFVIQGDQEDELPEQMMGSVRIHGVDPLKAPQLC